MFKLLLKFIFVAISLVAAAYFVSGVGFDSWTTLLIAAVVFGLLNAIIKPILHVLTLPITIMTLGLFTIVINMGVFWLLTFVPGFQIDGFMAAFWGSLVVTIVSWVSGLILDK